MTQRFANLAPRFFLSGNVVGDLHALIGRMDCVTFPCTSREKKIWSEGFFRELKIESPRKASFFLFSPEREHGKILLKEKALSRSQKHF